MTLMICMTLITLYFYIRIIMTSLSLYSNEMFLSKFYNMSFSVMFLNSINISSLIMLSLVMMT